MRILFDGRIFLHLFYLEVHCGTLYRSCFYIKACKVIWSWIILMMIVIIITSIMAHGFISLLFSRWRGNLSKYWWTNQRYSLRISWDSWKCLGERKYFRSSLLELKSNHRKYRRKRIEKVIFCKGQWCEVCRHEILFDERIEASVMDEWKEGRVVPWICVSRMRMNWEFSQKIYWLSSPYNFDDFIHLVTLFNYKINNFSELKLQINDRMTTTVEEEALNRTVLQVYFLHCTLHSTSLYVDRHLIWCPEGLWSLLCF